MLWSKGGGDAPADHPAEDSREERHEPIQLERDAERPATILWVATELERRGAEIVELFKEISTDRGRAMLPIHLLWHGQSFFVEIETRRWRQTTVEKILQAAAVLRSSDYADAGLGLLSAYPPPKKIGFFLEKSPAALFQLDLYIADHETPEGLSEAFVRAARRRWDVELDHDPDSLPLVEELLLAALREDPENSDEVPQVLGVLVQSLGCYVGEVIRQTSGLSGSWADAGEWGEASVLELDEFTLDPIGKARAFLGNGDADSLTYYARYVLRELEETSSAPETRR